MRTNSIFIVVVYIIFVSGTSFAARLNLHQNFNVTYDLVNNTTLKFVISSLTRGWMSIGFKNEGGSSSLTDVFMGSVNRTHAYFYNDCYIPANGRLQVDTKNDWRVSTGSLTGPYEDGTFDKSLTMTRLLDTSDTQHDIVIPDKKITLTWSYGDNDDFNTSAVAHGTVSVNLVSSGDMKRTGLGVVLVIAVAALLSATKIF